MDQVKLLLIFAQVMKQGSMNGAARVLGMSPSAVSQHLRNLEKHYGITLLNRTTRRLSPTEAGKTLWLYADKLQHLVDEADYSMQQLQSEPSGKVVIALPAGYVETPVMQRVIRQVQKHYPKIELCFQGNDRLQDLIAEEVDIAIRTTLISDANYIARPLAVWKRQICASPDYLAKNPILHKGDLLHCHWINHQTSVLQNTLAALDLPTTLPNYAINCSSASARQLALAGFGVTVLLSGDTAHFIEEGKLQVVLPQYVLPDSPIYAMTSHRNMSAKVVAILDILKKSFSS